MTRKWNNAVPRTWDTANPDILLMKGACRQLVRERLSDLCILSDDITEDTLTEALWRYYDRMSVDPFMTPGEVARRFRRDVIRWSSGGMEREPARHDDGQRYETIGCHDVVTSD